MSSSPNRYGPSDTDPRVDAVHVEMLRRAGPSRRLALARSMTATAISLSRRALERVAARGTGEGAGAIDLRYVELVYGEELATRLAARLSEGTK